MSKKLLFANSKFNSSLVMNRYNMQYEGYPIAIIGNSCLDDTVLTYIDEISGNVNETSDKIEIIGDLQEDGTYKIDIISCDNQFCFGRGGKIE